ncbi:MAG TPA: nicotinate-nucleotide adenylyltransferase [Pirellulales bacterium]|jgi:nicotinate-nucleotide adenylyltransferase|nr:nicotinate-nucleotide adenylyltransferase [Pirellulales bacterium]
MDKSGRGGVELTSRDYGTADSHFDQVVMRLGILGGSFDPVHLGHLLLAEQCREQCRLDRVLFVPAAIPPHKQRQHLTPAEQRIEMLRLAIGGHPAFAVWSGEVERGGISYTVETLAQLQQEREPDEAAPRELYFLMGADSLADLPNWREPARICELAIPVAVRRSGSPEPAWDVLRPWVSAARLSQIRASQVQIPLIDLSSRSIRALVAAGASIRYQTPRAVELYIQTHGLYLE